jgi:2-dehydro-3-deoxygluconokinase
VASLLAKLGHEATWLGALGTDPFGDLIVEALEEDGVNVDLVRREAAFKTGVYFKDFTTGSTRVFYYRDFSAGSAMDPSVLDAAASQEWSVVHVSGITPALSDSCDAVVRAVLDRARLIQKFVSFDVNFRPTLWPASQAAPILKAYANEADIVFVGLDEAKALWGVDSAADVRNILSEPRYVVVKNSDVDAVEFDQDNTSREFALSVDVVEKVGAGDAFAAGWLSGFLSGRPPGQRLRLGHLMAAEVLKTTTDSAKPLSAGQLDSLLTQSLKNRP